MEVTEAMRTAAAVRRLGVPNGHQFAAHLGVGWPAQPHPKRLRRRLVEDFATLDRLDGRALAAT